MQIRESAEDYLEAILRLSQKGGGVRSVDIATMLSVSKPSVSHAMKLLREDGYIAMDRYGTVTLLDKGAEIANVIQFSQQCWRAWEFLQRLPERMRVKWNMISVMRALQELKNV